MGIFDIFKGKHKDDVYHSGSREAQRHWAQYQRFKDAKGRVLNEPINVYAHGQSLNHNWGQQYKFKNIESLGLPQGQSDPNRRLKVKGFNTLANSMTAGEAASLIRENPDGYDHLVENLSDMKRRLEDDFTKENFEARDKAIRAEIAACVSSGKVDEVFAKYQALFTDKEAFAEFSKETGLRTSASHATGAAMQTAVLAQKYQPILEAARDKGNTALEEHLGLKEGSLKGSILGDPVVMVTNSNVMGKDYETNEAPFKDGDRDSRGFASGSHLMMIETTLDILEGHHEVPAKHADKSLNEYFSALQQEMQRPAADDEPNLGRTPDMGDRDR